MIMMIFMIIMKMGGGCWCWYWQSSVRWTTYMSCHDDSYENGRRMLMLMLMITSVRWTTQKFSSTVCPGSRRDLNQQIITIIMHSDLNQHIIRIIIHCHHDLDARSHVPPFHDQNVHFQSDHENCWVNKFIMFPLPFDYHNMNMMTWLCQWQIICTQGLSWWIRSYRVRGYFFNHHLFKNAIAIWMIKIQNPK